MKKTKKYFNTFKTIKSIDKGWEGSFTGRSIEDSSEEIEGVHG